MLWSLESAPFGGSDGLVALSPENGWFAGEKPQGSGVRYAICWIERMY